MQRLKSAYEKLSKQKKAVATEWKALEKEQKEGSCRDPVGFCEGSVTLCFRYLQRYAGWKEHT